MKELTDDERLEIAIALLTEEQVEQYCSACILRENGMDFETTMNQVIECNWGN